MKQMKETVKHSAVIEKREVLETFASNSSNLVGIILGTCEIPPNTNHTVSSSDFLWKFSQKYRDN